MGGKKQESAAAAKDRAWREEQRSHGEWLGARGHLHRQVPVQGDHQSPKRGERMF